MDTADAVCPDDPRKKSRDAKLRKIPKAPLSILSVPRATGHQDGHGRREWPVKGSCNAWSGRLRFRSRERGSAADNLGPFAFNSGRGQNIARSLQIGKAARSGRALDTALFFGLPGQGRARA